MEGITPGTAADWFVRWALNRRCYFHPKARFAEQSLQTFGFTDGVYLARAICAEKGCFNCLTGFFVKAGLDWRLESEVAFVRWSMILNDWQCPNCKQEEITTSLYGVSKNRRALIVMNCRQCGQGAHLPLIWKARLEPLTVDDVLDAHENLKQIFFKEDLFAKDVARRVQTS